jgi:GAF domain-containing protein
MAHNGTIQEIAKDMAESLGALACTIRVPQGEFLTLAAASGIDADKRKKRITQKDTIAGQAIKTGEPVLIPDITKHPLYDPQYIPHTTGTALMALPFRLNGTILGVAQLYSKEQFSPYQEGLAKILAKSAAMAIYVDQTSRMNRRALIEISEVMTRKGKDGKNRERKEILQDILEIITKHLEIESGVIFSRSERCWCEIVCGIPSVGKHGIGLKEEIKKHLDIEDALKSNRPIIIRDPLTNPKIPRKIAEDQRLSQILYVPILGNSVIVLNASDEKTGFNAAEEEFCADAGQLITTVFRRSEDAISELRDSLFHPVSEVKRTLDTLNDLLPNILDIEKKCKPDCGMAQGLRSATGEASIRVTEFNKAARRLDNILQKIAKPRI